MARVPLRDPNDLPASLERMRQEKPDYPMLLPLLQGFAEAPELIESYLSWYVPWHLSEPSVHARLPKRLKELVRLRVATFTGCQICKSARMTEDVLPEELAAGVDTADAELSAAERAALRFAEKLALDHFRIDDGDFAELREQFDNAQLLELVMLIGIVYVGGGLAMSVLQLDNASCPLPSAPPAWSAECDGDAGLTAQREFAEASRR